MSFRVGFQQILFPQSFIQSRVLSLYRKFFQAVRQYPVESSRKKILYNIKEAFYANSHIYRSFSFPYPLPSDLDPSDLAEYPAGVGIPHPVTPPDTIQFQSKNGTIFSLPVSQHSDLSKLLDEFPPLEISQESPLYEPYLQLVHHLIDNGMQSLKMLETLNSVDPDQLQSLSQVN